MTIEDEMVRWHHRLNGREFGYTPGAGDGQGGLDCSLPGFSVHGILQARGLEWGAITFSCSVAKLCLFVTPWTAARQAPLSSAVS